MGKHVDFISKSILCPVIPIKNLLLLSFINV